MARDWNEIITGSISDAIVPGSTTLRSAVRPKANKGVNLSSLAKIYGSSLISSANPLIGLVQGLRGAPKPKSSYPTPAATTGSSGFYPGNQRMFEEGQNEVLGLYDKFGRWLGDKPDTTPDTVAPFDLSQLFGLMGSGGSAETKAPVESATERAARLKAEQATKTAGGLMDMIESGSYKQPYTDMRSLLARYLSGAQKDIGSAYSGAKTAVGEQYAVNPYEGLTGTASVADPALESLLSSQGASTDPLAQMVAANREAAQQRANAFTDVGRQMATGFTQRGRQAQADIGSMEAQSLLDLLSQGGAYGQQITSNESAALKSLQDALADTAGQGADLEALVQQRLSATTPESETATEATGPKTDASTKQIIRKQSNLAKAPKNPKGGQVWKNGPQGKDWTWNAKRGKWEA